MAGIIGIQGNHQTKIAHDMLSKILHRSKKHSVILLKNGLTIGIVSNDLETICNYVKNKNIFSVSNSEDATSVALLDGKLSLKRDKYGVDPLYYVLLEGDKVAFASEVKALLEFDTNIKELAPGFLLEDSELIKYYELVKENPIEFDKNTLSILLRNTLLESIKKRISGNSVGAWLSGGLDSSVLSVLARPLVDVFHTFSVGFKDAADLQYAKIVAEHIGSKHHERLVTFADIIKVLPEVIYHLESFDGLLVRSSLMNYLVAQLSSEYVEEVFSSEGGDELFAGYQYIKGLPQDRIDDELIDITKSLHNTALQRVDRCSNAFGITAHVPFLDEDVVDLAVKIPVEYKLREGTEKWILRSALENDLPSNVLKRTKSKFWEGSGMGEHFYSYAESQITDLEFQNEKNIRCGWELNSKEELMYYRIFKEYFGELDDLDWLGRTKMVTTKGELNEG